MSNLEFTKRDGTIPVLYSGIFTIILDRQKSVCRYFVYKKDRPVTKTYALKSALQLCEILNTDYIAHADKYNLTVPTSRDGVFIDKAILNYLTYQQKVNQNSVDLAKQYEQKINSPKVRYKNPNYKITLLEQKILSLSNKIDKKPNSPNIEHWKKTIKESEIKIEKLVEAFK